MMKRTLQSMALAAACVAGCAPQSLAQQVQFRIQPETLRVGQVATAEFTVRGTQTAARPQLPAIDGLQISYMGHSMQRSLSSQSGAESLTTYKYSVVPLKPGDFTIGPFTYKAAGAHFGVPAVKLNVLPPGGSGQGAEQQKVDWNSLIFATMETKTPEVFNQQFLDIELAIYFRDHLRLDNQVQPINLPTAGLTIKEMRSLSEKREQVNGEIYEVRRFMIKFQAITEGTFTLAPTLRAHILVDRPNRQSGTLFDDVFGRITRYEKHPVDLRPKPLELKVNPIPTQNRPANYQGAVGAFALNIQATPRSIQAGDPVTIRTVITGSGNLEALTAPALTLGNDFRVYDSKLISKDLHASGSSGSKTFEQVIIPKKSGDVALPPLVFSFYNPKLRSFVELKKEGLVIQVRESDQPATAVVMSQGGPAAARQLQVVDLDIAYIKPLPRAWTGLNTGAALPGPAWIHGLPPIGLALMFLLTRGRRRREGNVQLQRRQAAPRKARAGIAQAQQALAAEDIEAYYEAVYRAIFDFYSNRLGWAPGEFDSTKLAGHLQQQRQAEEDIDFLRSLLVHAESVRYGADLPESARREAGQDQLQRLSGLLKRSERS